MSNYSKASKATQSVLRLKRTQWGRYRFRGTLRGVRLSRNQAAPSTSKVLAVIVKGTDGLPDCTVPVRTNVTARHLPFIHFPGDVSDRFNRGEMGPSSLFDACQADGHHHGKGWDNLGALPKASTLADGRALVRERERDELELLVMQWREAQAQEAST